MTTLEMDEPREIRWDFRAIKNFEQRSKNILTRLQVAVPNIIIQDGRAVDGGKIPIANANANRIMASFVNMAEILEVAVGAATGLSYLEAKGEPSQAAKAIDGWLAGGKSMQDLGNELYKEFVRATDPLAFARVQEAAAKKAEAEAPTE
ncbi:MAG: hypothetical protein PHG75_06365 [Syntrophomonas sp.]|nr:hypothetical protein [Syntrophomonas sp.]